MTIKEVCDEQDLCAFLADIDCGRQSKTEMAKLIEAVSSKAKEIMFGQVEG